MPFTKKMKVKYLQLKNGKLAQYTGKDTDGIATYHYEDSFDGHLVNINHHVPKTMTFNKTETTFEEHHFDFLDPADGQLYRLALRSTIYVTYDLVNRLCNIAVQGYESDESLGKYAYVTDNLQTPVISLNPYELKASGDFGSSTWLSIAIGNTKIMGLHNKVSIDQIAPITFKMMPIINADGTLEMEGPVPKMTPILVDGKTISDRTLRDKWINDRTEELIDKLTMPEVIAAQELGEDIF